MDYLDNTYGTNIYVYMPKWPISMSAYLHSADVSAAVMVLLASYYTAKLLPNHWLKKVIIYDPDNAPT